MGSRLSTAFIFDFDGTLVNSEQAIYQCFHNITKKIAPDRIEYVKNIIIGPPLRETASEILGQEFEYLLDEFVKLFIKFHDNQVIQHTQPYPNVTNVLKKLEAKKIPMAIATNKREAPTKILIDHLRWKNYFHLVKCSDSSNEIISKKQMIYQIKSFNNNFEDAFYVGDTVNDGISANQNGLSFIKANYGYGQMQDWKNIKIYKEINNIEEILKI